MKRVKLCFLLQDNQEYFNAADHYNLVFCSNPKTGGA